MTKPRTSLTIVLASLAMLLAGAHASAADERLPFGQSDEMRGMFVFKVPFGSDGTLGSPRLGLDLHTKSRGDLDRLERRYDDYTGRRLPDIDADRMRTWSIDPKDYRLPEERRDEREAATPSGPLRPRG